MLLLQLHFSGVEFGGNRDPCKRGISETGKNFLGPEKFFQHPQASGAQSVVCNDDKDNSKKFNPKGGRGLVRMACGRERNGTRTEIRFECNEARTEDLIRGEK